jgi:hypothetical protein
MRPLPTKPQAAPRKAPMAQTQVSDSADRTVESSRAEPAHVPRHACDTGLGCPGNADATGFDPGDT